MINEKEKNIIIKYAKKYNVSKIFLFGSSLVQDEYNDIDLAVSGIKPDLFFKFYGDLLRNLTKPVDLVDLSQKSFFIQIIQKNGVKIYG
ncbi:MAG: nucleotidyltransferase domain-containing protein [Promethearchaeota archaeon]|nr:MAG: nucleotidyltransferase domain-containing protein [Candidatus Lokiarchaeota archaeon]